jgi:hypothetical protein
LFIEFQLILSHLQQLVATAEFHRSLMKMKPLTKNGFKKRLEISRRRSEDLHGQIGIISSGFSWLESRLIDMLSQCVNDINPKKANDIISQLSFRQCVNLFQKMIPKWYPNPKITSQVKDLTKRLDKISERRNEFIHSHWVNYSPNIVAQNRPRSKGGKPSGSEMHDKNIIKNMSLLIEEMDELIFDFDLFICNLYRKNSEQDGCT